MECERCQINLEGSKMPQKLCFDCGNKYDRCYICGTKRTISDTVLCEKHLVEFNGRCECGSPKGGVGNCLAMCDK